MNAYYLVTDLSALPILREAAPSEGLPHQLLGLRWSADGSQCIAQAEWPDEWGPPAGVSLLGSYLPNGSAEQTVYEELAKAEWQSGDEVG